MKNLNTLAILGIVIVFALLLISSVGYAQNVETKYQWSFITYDVPNDVPVYPRIGVGDDGTIWVAYEGASSSSDFHYINVSWYDGNWHTAMVDKVGFNSVGSGEDVPTLALIMVGNVPHIFYYSFTSATGYLNHSYYTGSSWTTETVWSGSLMENTGLPGNSISADYIDGKFYVVFQRTNINALSTPENVLSLVYGTSGSWSMKDVIKNDTYHYFYGYVDAYSSNKIGIAIYEADMSGGSKVYHIEYTEFDGSSFAPIENIASNSDDYSAKFAFDSSGVPHIFYSRAQPDGSTYLTELVKTSSGWSSSDIDTRTGSPGGPMDVALLNGHLNIVYNKEGQSGIQFAEYTSSGWAIEEIVDSLSGNALKHTCSLTNDSLGNIYVAYFNWDAVKADNTYLVIATTNSSIPEFDYGILGASIVLIAIAVILSKKIS